MANANRYEPGAVIGDFRLLQQAGGTESDVWKAEDLRSSRVVALKILSRSLPRDKARRDALVSTIRQNGAMSHPAFARVLDFVVTENDEMLMISEWLTGTALSRRQSIAPPRELARTSWQLAEALQHAHDRGVIHGNLSTDNLIIDSAGNLRITGLGLAALTGRRERGDATTDIEVLPFDVNALAHSSPEQLSGKAIDSLADVYGVGTVVYELATGRPAFGGATTTEVANNVVKLNPRNPSELNPSITPAVLQIIGRCLFKKKESRYASLSLLLDDLKKVEPNVQSLAAYPKEAGRPGQPSAVVTTLFVAEIPYADLIMKKDPDRATQLEARMQQILGEAIYLFDGELIDSMGPRMVGCLSSPEKALQAARKALDDLAEYNETVETNAAIEPRMLLHRGDIVRNETGIEGEAHRFALQVLASLEPMQLLVSEPVLRAANVRGGNPVGSIGGVSFYELPDPAAAVTAAPAAAPQSSVADAQLDVEEESAERAAPAVREPSEGRRSLLPLIAIAATAVLLLGGIFYFFSRHRDDNDSAGALANARHRPVVSADMISLQPLDAAAAPPETVQQSAAISSAVAELLNQNGTLKVVPVSEKRAMHLTWKPPVAAAAAGAPVTIVPQLGGKGDGPALTPAAAGDATTQLIRWLASSAGLKDADRLLSTNPEAMDAFVAAAARWNSSDPQVKKSAAESIRLAIAKDPSYVPASRLAFRIFSENVDRKEAIAVAERLSSIDPTNLPVLKQLTAWRAAEGNGPAAIQTAGLVLKQSPNDSDALSIVARYAIGAGDKAKFDKAMARLEVSPGATTSYVHRPDFAASLGAFDAAAKVYYDLEPLQLENADLAYKIGRIAAMRDSYEIADIELKKLQKLSPNYGVPLLEAYLAARKKETAKVDPLLKAAEASGGWHDDFYTSMAEIYAMLNDKVRVVTALEKAAARGEATENMILNKQTFFYLGYDARSTRVKNLLEGKKAELSKALNDLLL